MPVGFLPLPVAANKGGLRVLAKRQVCVARRQGAPLDGGDRVREEVPNLVWCHGAGLLRQFHKRFASCLGGGALLFCGLLAVAVFHWFIAVEVAWLLLVVLFNELGRLLGGSE